MAKVWSFFPRHGRWTDWTGLYSILPSCDTFFSSSFDKRWSTVQVQRPSYRIWGDNYSTVLLGKLPNRKGPADPPRTYGQLLTGCYNRKKNSGPKKDQGWRRYILGALASWCWQAYRGNLQGSSMYSISHILTQTHTHRACIFARMLSSQNGKEDLLTVGGTCISVFIGCRCLVFLFAVNAVPICIWIWRILKGKKGTMIITRWNFNVWHEHSTRNWLLYHDERSSGILAIMGPKKKRV